MLYNIFEIFKSKRGKYALAFFSLLIIVIIITKSKTKNEAIPQQEIIVSAKTIIPEEKVISLSAYGTTIANTEISLKANVAGKLIKKYYQKGNLVNDGVDLFSFISLEYSTIIEKAQLNLTKLEQEYLKLKQHPKTSQAELAKLEKAVELAKDHLKNVSSYTNFLTIRAPFTGIINDIHVEEGETVKAGDLLAKIIQIVPTKVQINIPEKFINDIKLNEQIYLEILDKQNILATINYISSSIDPSTKTFVIEALIKEGSFPTGTTVTATIPLNKVLSYKITRSALTIDNSNNLGILYIDQENKAQFLASEIIEDNQDNLWIKSNSNSPLKIITNGSGFIIPNSKVTSEEEHD